MTKRRLKIFLARHWRVCQTCRARYWFAISVCAPVCHFVLYTDIVSKHMHKSSNFFH